MALAAVGVKTQIWNNEIKSVLLLLGFPLLLVGMTLAFFCALAYFDPGYTMTAPEMHRGVYVGQKTIQVAPPDWMERGLEQFSIYWPIPIGVAAVWFLFAGLFHQQLIEDSTGSRPVTRQQEPRLYNLLENLCISRGLPIPRLSIMETEALNAFASGISRKSYNVSVTRGLLNTLNDEELEAVLAHELTHIMNHDVRLLIIAVIFVGMISFFCEMIVRSFRHVRFSGGGGRKKGGGVAIIMLIALVILAIGYGLSIVIRFALSRQREYLADLGAVELTRNPNSMIAALKKIDGNSEIKRAPDEVRQMFIDNNAAFLGIFATHPSIEKRIKTLVLAGGQAADESQPTLIPREASPWSVSKPFSRQRIVNDNRW